MTKSAFGRDLKFKPRGQLGPTKPLCENIPLHRRPLCAFLPTVSGAPTPVSKPSRTGGLLDLVRKLIDYATFLADTLRQHGLGEHPAIHGRQFGTINITLILARIGRGLLRAAALEARLHRNAARLDAPPRPHAPPARPLSASTEASPQPAAPSRRFDPSGADEDTLLARMPTPEQIAAEIRRRPIGEVIADICRDLGIVPAHPLWTELARAIMREGGRYAALIIDILKRPERLPIPEDWPERLPPYLWTSWQHSPALAGTGPP
jgi:hypothetical protein